MASLIAQLDSHIGSILADWSLVTTSLLIVILAFAVYPVIYSEEPDTHPLLLARQASPSQIRNKGESAIYRSPEVPHGYPLKTGLNVKDAAAPRWASGKDGDLRDVWREVQKGGRVGPEDRPVPKGVIMTVLGKQQVLEHDVDELSKEIGILGKHMQAAGASRVAIYLPNSIEYLLAIFACSFYELTPILLPYNQPHAKCLELINETGATGIICAAGSLPLDDVAQQCKQLRLLTWVVESTSRHMDWNGVPDAAQARLSVSVWHDVVQENIAEATPNLPNNEGVSLGQVVVVWQSTQPGLPSEIVTFTHANLVSATAALISAVPLRQRLTPEDLVLPADTFTHTYVLCQALAALYTHSSLAISSVAMPGVDLSLASRGVAPTVIIASAETMVKLHQDNTTVIKSVLQRFDDYTQGQSLSAGRMPTGTGLLVKLPSPLSSTRDPGRLRLILTSERYGAGSPPLTSAMLSDLRIATRSRIIYALTAAQIAGAVAQTSVFDYRLDAASGHSHFGIPVSSVEILLRGKTDADVDGTTPKGAIVVSGPSISGGAPVTLGATEGRIRLDNTIAYA